MGRISFILILAVSLSSSVLTGETGYRNGAAIGEPQPNDMPSCTVLQSVDSPCSQYTTGLAWDGEYLWVSDGFSGELYQFDFETGTVVSDCNFLDEYPRDLTWQALDEGSGTLWAGTWSRDGHVNKIDVENCRIVGGFDIPEMGTNKCNGAAWNYFNDGTEWRYELILGEESGDLYWIDPSTGSIDRTCTPFNPTYDPKGLAWDGFGIWTGYQSDGLIRHYDEDCIATESCLSTTLFQQGTTWDGHYLYTTGADFKMMDRIAKVDVGYELTVNIKQQGVTVPAGGQVILDVEVLNHTADPVPMDAWINAYLFNGNLFAGSPLLQVDATIPGNVMVTPTISIDVPQATPPGDYLLTANVGANNSYPVPSHIDRVRVTVTSPQGEVGEGTNVQPAQEAPAFELEFNWD